MDGVRRSTIKQLTPNIKNSLIIAVVIVKQRPRIFKGKTDSGEMRGVLNLSIRDSETDSINCTIWASAEFIHSRNQIIRIGDVVDIVNAKVSIRELTEMSEAYRPAVSSPFVLTLNEGVGDICIHDGDSYGQYMELIHVPTKSGECLTIADVQRSGNALTCDNVSLLVAVRQVKPVKDIKTKAGDERQCRDIFVMDQTSPGLLVQFWDPEMIQRADKWLPRKTLLYFTDLRVEWSNFHRAVMGSISPRTVITEDPLVPQADALREFARTAPMQDTAILEQMASTFPDPSSIRNVLTIAHMLDRAEGVTEAAGGAGEENQFSALIYAMVTHFDLDGFSKVVTIKCGRCKKRLEPHTPCINLECSVGLGVEHIPPVTAFDIRVALSDHTGTVSGCRLVDNFAENMLQCSVEEFLNMDMDSRQALKKRFLFERCAVRVLVMRSSALRATPLITILDCVIANPLEKPASPDSHIAVFGATLADVAGSFLPKISSESCYLLKRNCLIPLAVTYIIV